LTVNNAVGSINEVSTTGPVGSPTKCVSDHRQPVINLLDSLPAISTRRNAMSISERW